MMKASLLVRGYIIVKEGENWGNLKYNRSTEKEKDPIMY